MAGFTADPQFEDSIALLCLARHHGRLSDDAIRDLCAGLNDPLPDLPFANDDGDIIKVELIIRLARAHGRGTLTTERMQEIVARFARVSQRPVRVSMSPEVIVGEADPAEFDQDDELVDEGDVMDVRDEELKTVESEPDTDPPPATDS